MRLKQHNKKDLHPRKVFRQFFNAHNKEQEEQIEQLQRENDIQPINTETNCFNFCDVPVSFDDHLTNKEFYAMRRGKQNRFGV